MSFIIFDTEFTSWEGCMENGREDWQKEELVQIAALKVETSSLKVIEELNLFVKPSINPILSDYFIDLTGITNEKISKDGIPFADAYIKFYNFSKGLPCFSHGWTMDDVLSEDAKISDGIIINRNLEFNDINNELHFDYKNIGPWFKKMYEKHDIIVKNQCSGEIARILGVEKNITDMGIGIHNALYDVYSILEGIRYFKAENLSDLF